MKTRLVLELTIWKKRDNVNFLYTRGKKNPFRLQQTGVEDLPCVIENKQTGVDRLLKKSPDIKFTLRYRSLLKKYVYE